MTVTTASFVAGKIREELGDFTSIVFFKALITGLEEAIGEKTAHISLIAAGRTTGKKLTQKLGLSGKGDSLEEAAAILKQALGKDGTCLCVIDKIVEEGDVIKVYCHETICSSGEEPGSSRQLSYTAGVIQGALEELTGKRLCGKQVESVLRGSEFDVMSFESRG